MSCKGATWGTTPQEVGWDTGRKHADTRTCVIWQKYREPWQKTSDRIGMPMLHTWMPNLHAGHSCAARTVKYQFSVDWVGLCSGLGLWLRLRTEQELGTNQVQLLMLR